METVSTEVTSIRRQNDIEKSTWRTHWYFVDFESRIHVGMSTSNRCHNFHVDSPFKIDVISTNFPRGISMSNRWRIDEDVSIGNKYALYKKYPPNFVNVSSIILYKPSSFKFYLWAYIDLWCVNVTSDNSTHSLLIIRETKRVASITNKFYWKRKRCYSLC